jgi:phenylacetate-CoA ligase
MSSFGVGELGLHLCYETPATISLRRAAFENAAFAHDLLGATRDAGVPLPIILSFDPLRTFIEVIEPDDRGYGRLTVSMLDPNRTVPLLRYQTGDIVRLLDAAQVADVARRHGVALGAELPLALLAVLGREQEALPNGSHVAFYKDALYADHWLAGCLTGAFRVTFADRQCRMDVQLAAAQAEAHAVLTEHLLQAIPAHIRPQNLVLWPYAQFPFGMRLDYERKFAYYVGGDEASPHRFELPVQRSRA